MQTIPVKGLEPEDVAKPGDDDAKFHSVTTLIGALDKPALIYWSAEQTALAAVRSAGSLERRIEEEGEENVVKWLRDARFRQPKGRRTAAELGTAVHAACEEYGLTGVKPEVDAEVQPFLDRFDEWAARFQPEYVAVEATVYSPSRGYAGTCDGFFRLQGVPLILDYKSTVKDVDSQGRATKPYPEVALQLAAYRHAELLAPFRIRRYERHRRRFYLLNETERAMAVPVPEVDGGVVIHLTPNRCTAYPVNCGLEVFERFLFVAEAFRWTDDMAKRVIGEPLEVAA